MALFFKPPRFGLEFTDAAGNRRWPPIVVGKLPVLGRVRIDPMLIGVLFNLGVVHIGAAFAVWWFWTRGLTGFDILLWLGMHFAIGIGVTLGYHRYFCHKAFSAGHGTAAVLGALATASMQGRLKTWVSVHRKHHHHSDEEGDPHSPKPQSAGLGASLSALFDGHAGWIMRGRLCDYVDYIRDMRKDPDVAFVDKYYWVWAALGWIIPGLIALAWYGEPSGFISGLLAGGAWRTFWQMNATWAVNSLSHRWGSQPFFAKDDSRNNRLVNLLTLVGEGLHNNHHAFPWSARFSLLPGEVDPGYWVLRAMEKAGLARDLKIPTQNQLTGRLRQAAAE